MSNNFIINGYIENWDHRIFNESGTTLNSALDNIFGSDIPYNTITYSFLTLSQAPNADNIWEDTVASRDCTNWCQKAGIPITGETAPWCANPPCPGTMAQDRCQKFNDSNLNQMCECSDQQCGNQNEITTQATLNPYCVAIGSGSLTTSGSPTTSGGTPTTNESNNYCGLTWSDSLKCSVACPSGNDYECPNNEKCFSGVTCDSTTPSGGTSTGNDICCQGSWTAGCENKTPLTCLNSGKTCSGDWDCNNSTIENYTSSGCQNGKGLLFDSNRLIDINTSNNIPQGNGYPQGSSFWGTKPIDICKYFTEKGIKFIWGIGGWSDTITTPTDDDDDYIALLVNTIITLLNTGGDGGDFDWEHISHDTTMNREKRLKGFVNVSFGSKNALYLGV